MNKTVLTTFLLIAVRFLIWPELLLSQIKIHKSFSVDEGLPYSQVMCMHQDSRGFIWFGSSSGLAKWDGRIFTNFYKSDGLLSSDVIDIVEYSNGDLFVGTRQGPNLYQNGKFISFPNLPAQLKTEINSLAIKNDTVFIGTIDEGLWIYDGRDFKHIKTKSDSSAEGIFRLYMSLSGELYIAFVDKGAAVFSNGRIKTYRLPGNLTDIPVNVFYEFNNCIYVGLRGKGVFKSGENPKYFTVNNGMPDDFVMDFREGPSGELYVATQNGLAILKNDEIVETITTVNGLPNGFIWRVHHDDCGNYYLLTDGGGFAVYKPNRIINYKLSGLSETNTIWSIDQLKDNSILLGTDNGLMILDSKNDLIPYRKEIIKDNFIVSILQSSTGSLLLGTNQGVIDIFDGSNQILSTKNGLNDNSAWVMLEGNPGQIYIGTYGGGISVYENGIITKTYSKADGLPNDMVVSGFKDADGNLYFSFEYGGVYLIRNRKFFELDNRLGGETVWAVQKSSDGKFYLGTSENGLLILDGSKIDTLNTGKGISNNSIVSLLLDGDVLYAGSDNGFNIISNLNGEYFIRRLFKIDGLASSECNQNSIFKDNEGNIWIGTLDGATRYSPRFDLHRSDKPKLHFTSVKLFEKPVDFSNGLIELNLSYDENYLTFEFTGLDFSAPEKIRYEYKLSGSETIWLPAATGEVSFSGLDNGDYTLFIRAKNQWGIYSDPISAAIIISPPFWQTWWFILLNIIVIGGTIAVFAYLKFKSILQVERLRGKISADLHDDIGAGLSEISFLAEIADFKLRKHEKNFADEELLRIGTMSRSLIDSMSDIVWVIKPKNDSLFNLLSRLGEKYNELFAAKNIDFRISNLEELQKVKLGMEYRQNLLMIFKEALNNALKYSECKNVSLKVSIVNGLLTITLHDDGRGFNLEELKKRGNGLYNMQERAGQIGGICEIISGNGEGTTIVFKGTTNKVKS